MSKGQLQIRDVSKSYEVEGRPRLDVLQHASFDVAPGAFVSIVGPSGCGKSTLLRLIAGLDPTYTGDILVHGERIAGASLSRGIVFQDHRLLPWLTLEQNVGLSLLNSPWPPERKQQSVREHIALVGLSGFEKAYPHQLSGGMAQRAAIARALVNKPEILLLDEPLGALDALTRIRLQEEIQRIWRVEGVTMILVTHDVDEALFLSDKVIVMNAGPGRIVRERDVDLPRPRDRAGARFAEYKREILSAMGEYQRVPESVPA
nr:ABC transporter ATP-binding protein [Variovorax boronicumulans]